MPFDLATAKPIETEQPKPRGGFDLASAKPVEASAGAEPGMLEGLLSRTPTGRTYLGVARGAKDVVDTGAEWLARGFDKLTGADASAGEGARVKAMNAAGKAEFQRRYGGDTGMDLSRVGGQVLATLPVGGVAAAPVRALAAVKVAPKILAPIADAIETGGMRAAGTKGVVQNLAARSAGGAVTGGAAAGLVDPDSAGAGAEIGAVAPGATKIAAAAGRAAAGAVRPFFQSGQEGIVADTIKRFSSNPIAARAALAASKEMIPGSTPTAVMAAGDEGLSGLSRTMESVSPEYAANLSARRSAQNAARTASLDEIAGNPGKIAIAKEERDAATGAAREAVLKKAGDLPGAPLASRIDAMIADPNNAGKTAQQALSNVKDELARITGKDGTVNARALYEIRKDINLAMEGKLQGDAGNLKFAKGQLAQVKDHIDEAIDQASRGAKPGKVMRPGATGTSLVSDTGLPHQQFTEGVPSTVTGAQAAPRSWRDYLKTYADMSKPINQMETLQDVLKRIQTGTVDKSGNAILSAAKLNNILKNEGAELGKTLAPEQLTRLRKLASDLNASQLATTSGKAVGSNTVQNLAQTRLLDDALGSFGRSTPMTSTLGRLLQIPYGTANQQIRERLGNALLNPAETERLLASTEKPQLLRSRLASAAAIASRAAPLLPANPNR